MVYLTPNNSTMRRIKLSNSAKATLDLIYRKQIPLSVKDIKSELPYSDRTIHYALNQLREYALVERKNTLRDLRESIYHLSATASLYGYDRRSF